MLDAARIEYVEPPAETPPILLVTVDTEEEFDWARPLSRENRSVKSVADQRRAHDVFARYGIVPTYVIDYPVATDDAAVRCLDDLRREGACRIGAHLHPWVNPPHEESVSPHNSYPGNLPPALEREKLAALTRAIEKGIGVRPSVYKAGRYGIGPATAATLEALGYEVDLSVVPYTSFAADGGPDFRSFDTRPYWFGASRRLLEAPMSCGFAGVLADHGPELYPALAGAVGMAVRAPGVLARLRLLERVRLTPEGVDLPALKRLSRSLMAAGRRVFSLAYHSPSLAPGNTPYVRDQHDLAAFLDTLDGYFDYFINELGGRPTTPSELYDLLTDRPVAAIG